MYKFITIAYLLLGSNISVGQQPKVDGDSCSDFLYFQKSEKELHNYVNNPCSTDSLCLSEIAKAKADISNGKIVFCMPQSMLNWEIRQEAELRELCNKNNIDFKYEYFIDIVEAGETQGCYGLYMDNIIAEKFGENFKENLLDKADTLLLASNKTIDHSLCDKVPVIPGIDPAESNEFYVKIEDTLYDQIIKGSCYRNSLSMFIRFIVDKKGIPSGYYLENFDDCNEKENQKFKDELYEIGVNYLKQFKQWIPGQVKGQNVTTDMDVLIYFDKASD